MSDHSTAPAGTSSTARSRITNGSDVLPGIDGRTRIGRRFRDILDELVVEFDIAGSESDMRLAREATHLSVWLEGEAARTARGESVDIGAVTTTTNTLRRLLSDLSASARRRRSNKGSNS
jgi:hypothetical protein